MPYPEHIQVYEKKTSWLFLATLFVQMVLLVVYFFWALYNDPKKHPLVQTLFQWTIVFVLGMMGGMLIHRLSLYGTLRKLRSTEVERRDDITSTESQKLQNDLKV